MGMGEPLHNLDAGFDLGFVTGLADAGTYFHTDYSYLEVPARATALTYCQLPVLWLGSRITGR